MFNLTNTLKTYIEKNNTTAIWEHFTLLLLHNLQPEDKVYEIVLYSILYTLSKKADIANTFLEKILNLPVIHHYDTSFLQNKPILNHYNLYFIWNQFKAISLRNICQINKRTNELMDTLYQKSYDGLATELKSLLNPIPLQERHKNRVMVFTIQFLGANHAPTKTTVERCHSLSQLGKEVYLINTREQYTTKGMIPIYNPFGGSVIEDYSNQQTMDIHGENIHFYQPAQSMPNLEEIIKILQIIQEFKPCYILSIGTGSIIGDLCNQVVPCIPMSLAFSTLPKSINKTKIIGRKLTETEKLFYQSINEKIIESRFTFQLKSQTTNFSRKDFSLPENTFLLVVVGIRLDYEITDTFIQALEPALISGGHIVFAGNFSKYSEFCNASKVLEQHSHFIGYCNDILALMEICDLYVNPNRLGGGFSIIEAFSKGKPGVYLQTGDVYTAGGDEFSVTDYSHMTEKILQYMNDADYYKEMQQKALDRATVMTDSITAMEDLDNKIMNQITSR